MSWLPERGEAAGETMYNQMHHWFMRVALRDPIQRQQAPLIQIVYLVLIIGALLWVPISLSSFVGTSARVLSSLSSVSVVASTVLAFVLLRQGRFTSSVVLATTGIFLAVALVLVVTGLRQSGGLLFAFALPMTLAGLLLGHRGLLIFSGMCLLAVSGVLLLEYTVPTATGFGSLDEPISVLGTVTLALAMLGLFLGSFGTSLRDALTIALVREQDLERAQGALEAAVQTGEMREVRLTQTLDELRTSQAAVHALSAPIIPVLPGVLVAPLIGTLDRARVTTLATNVLSEVERLQARHVIFDITGVPLVDSDVAQTLLQVAVAVRLMGAEVLLVGIRPEVAQTIVASGSTLGTIITHADLQRAITTLLATDSATRFTAY
jgi:rsbT co-antagonist protein RsbR